MSVSWGFLLYFTWILTPFAVSNLWNAASKIGLGAYNIQVIACHKWFIANNKVIVAN